MDIVDKKILDIIQHEIPIVKKPYKVIADQLGIEEEDVLERIRKLKQEGIIRRVGGSFDSQKLGYSSVLVATKVSPDKLEETAKKLNRYTGITHNYQRDHAFNLWFTLTASSEQRVTELLEILKKETGIQEMVPLPSLKKYKIKVYFKMTEDN